MENIDPQPIPLPNWDGVRIIYRKLSEEFHVLASAFNIVIHQEIMLHLDHLIIAIDEIDNCVDEIRSKQERDSITSSLITFLSDTSDKWSHPSATASLATKIENLKLVVNERKIQTAFINAAQSIFHFTEIKRHTDKLDDLVNYVVEEGKATSILPLSILGINSTDPFGEFFTKLCMVMGLADLIIDARQDYRKGYISIKPSIRLYIKLAKVVMKDGFILLTKIPRKMKFMSYCFSFSIALIKG